MEKNVPQLQSTQQSVQNTPKSRSPKNSRLFYSDKPIFGMDISAGRVKAIQVAQKNKKYTVVGHGSSDFETSAIVDGVITQPDYLAKVIKELLRTGLKGSIASRRLGFTIPCRRCFIRSMTVPAIAARDLASAVSLEVEQYIPLPTTELYVDYTVTRRTASEVELLVVVVPKKIVDSYLALAEAAGLEPVIIEPTITANARLFAKLEQATIPTILIDFGLTASDVMVFDQTLITASMVVGDNDASPPLATQTAPEMPKTQALISDYKPSKSTTNATLTILMPELQQLVQEIKRIRRYYSDHVNNAQQIEQIVVMDGANIPELSNYLTDALQLPTKFFEPWQKIDFGTLGSRADRHSYTAAMGLALLEQRELFR